MTTVTVRRVRAYQQEITAREHVIFADEPIEAGGDDTGPTPYELLLAALGSCTAITLSMYAQRKGWSLEQIEIELTHDRSHAHDCASCAQQATRLERITRRIRLGGALDDAQRARLLEIAQRCPVHRTLSAGAVEIVDQPDP